MVALSFRYGVLVETICPVVQSALVMMTCWMSLGPETRSVFARAPRISFSSLVRGPDFQLSFGGPDAPGSSPGALVRVI
jgi:hypothetical protein